MNIDTSSTGTLTYEQAWDKLDKELRGVMASERGVMAVAELQGVVEAHRRSRIRLGAFDAVRGSLDILRTRIRNTPTPTPAPDALRTLAERVTERRNMWQAQAKRYAEREGAAHCWAHSAECNAVLSLIAALDTGAAADEPDTFGLPAARAMGHAAPEAPDEQDVVPDGLPLGDTAARLREVAAGMTGASFIRWLSTPEAPDEQDVVPNGLPLYFEEGRSDSLFTPRPLPPVPLAMLPLATLLALLDDWHNTDPRESREAFVARWLAEHGTKGEGDGDAST